MKTACAPATYTLRFPGLPALANQLRGHWAKGARLKKRDRGLVAIAANNADVPKATGKRRVSVHLVLGPTQRRKPDGDAPWKSLLDALVGAGVLVDDSSRWCEQGGVTFSRGPHAETVVTLTEMEE